MSSRVTRPSEGRERAALEPRYDVVVAGARCAGASTALLLARRGLDVLVVDPLPRARDTLSTHALMRGAVLQLHRWGVLNTVRAEGTPAIRATTFDYGRDVITVPIKPGGGVDALYAPRRTVLDPILSDAAERAGAHVARGLAVADVRQDARGRVRGVTVRGPDGASFDVQADLVVGADGVHSKIARAVEAPFSRRASHATASIYGYWAGLDADEFRWYFRPGVGIGTIPTNGGSSCVFASVPPRRFRAARSPSTSTRRGVEALFAQVVESVDPALARYLASQPSTGGLRAFAGIPGYLRRSAGPGWALVGDAGYFKDPLTAHGITDALRDAELLARAVLRGGDDALEEYEAERDEAAVTFMDVTDRIAALDGSMDELQQLHLELSDAMRTDLEMIRSFTDTEVETTLESPAEVTPRRRRTA